MKRIFRLELFVWNFSFGTFRLELSFDFVSKAYIRNRSSLFSNKLNSYTQLVMSENICLSCDIKFINSKSLATHTNKFHKKYIHSNKTSAENDEHNSIENHLNYALSQNEKYDEEKKQSSKQEYEEDEGSSDEEEEKQLNEKEDDNESKASDNEMEDEEKLSSDKEDDESKAYDNENEDEKKESNDDEEMEVEESSDDDSMKTTGTSKNKDVFSDLDTCSNKKIADQKRMVNVLESIENYLKDAEEEKTLRFVWWL